LTRPGGFSYTDPYECELSFSSARGANVGLPVSEGQLQTLAPRLKRALDEMTRPSALAGGFLFSANGTAGWQDGF